MRDRVTQTKDEVISVVNGHDIDRSATMAAVAVKPQRLSETVADRIMDFVIAQRLQPGQKLPAEPELAELFGVSRTVVREAGSLLVGRGLVDIRAGRGMAVAQIDGSSMARQYRLLLEMKQGSFQQLMELRLVLEIGICRLAAQRHQAEGVARIQQALDGFNTEADHVTALEADLDFHIAIALAADNPFFLHLAVPINRYLRRAYRESLGYEAARQQTADEHAEIARAISASHADEAGDLMKNHLIRILAGRSELVAEGE